MDRWAGRVAVVTGASSGIGASIAQTLAKHGMNVVGLARNSEKIDQLAKDFGPEIKGSITGMKCDLSRDEDVEKSFNVSSKRLCFFIYSLEV